eukprot:SAG31_NODE_187_length_20848_cov_22.521953_23_plen_83_part_00
MYRAWATAKPVLSPRFVRLFQAVYGAVVARLETAGLLSLVSTVWIKDEPEYNDPFTLAALVLLHEQVLITPKQSQSIPINPS